MSRRRPEPIACDDCGTVVVMRRHYGRPARCPECQIIRAADAARQMAAKSGPVWDAWLANTPRSAGGHRQD